jgi:hypothetical protein
MNYIELIRARIKAFFDDVVWWAKMIGVMVVALIPGACHLTLTGPILWTHNSSRAFDTWVSFWIIDIMLVCAAFVSVMFLSKTRRTAKLEALIKAQKNAIVSELK